MSAGDGGDAGTSAPILEYDPDPRGIIDPGMVPPRDVPEHAVLCFFGEVVEKLAAGARPCFKLRSEAGTHVAYEIVHHDRRLAFFQPGVGAPLAAAFLEQAIARGCRRFAACGGAGALVPELALGRVVVPSAAIRDEGTSYHYLPPAREVEVEPAAVTIAAGLLAERGLPYVTGKTWSTDGIYRETRARAARRREEGCLVVEMEAAALLAVARFRGVPLAYLLYAGDSLAGESWESRDWQRHDGREALFWLAADICLRL
ncbi:MAG TPA: nucleoside phosphorylase [Candidatus Dormibacteraeota bacterium]|nr:nucleoside phosphorylase [Candidatus Dormibacteraeota bacterium]